MSASGKNELLKDCVEILKRKDVGDWYEKYLVGKPQKETINELERAVLSHELSVHDALAVCLVVGVQWSTKFEGVP